MRYSSALCALLLLSILSATAFAADTCTDFSNGLAFSDFVLDKNSALPGEIASGSLYVTNTLDYPVSGVSVSLQLLRESGTPGAGDIVYEMPVSDAADFGARVKKKFAFDAAIPAGLPSGDYALKAIASSPSAISASTRVGAGTEAGTARFRVIDSSDASAPAADYAFIPRESVAPVSFIGEPDFAIAFNLENRGAAGPVSYAYNMYYVDKEKHYGLEALVADGKVSDSSHAYASLQAARIVFGSSTFEMAENEARAMSVPVGRLAPGKYLLEITAGKAGAQTTMPISITVPGQSGLITFASLEPFPFEAGRQVAIATCAYAHAGAAIVPENESMAAPAGSTATLRYSVSYAGSENGEGEKGERLLRTDGETTYGSARFTPAANASEASVLVELVSDGGEVLDAAESKLAEASLGLPAILTLTAKEDGGVIAYVVQLTDIEGRFLSGTIEMVLMNAQGEVIDTPSGQITGKVEGALVAPYGGYLLRATEPTYGVSAEASNATPYSYDREVPLPDDVIEQPGGVVVGGQPINLLVAFAAIGLVGAGIALLLYAMRKLGGKKESKFDDMEL